MHTNTDVHTKTPLQKKGSVKTHVPNSGFICFVVITVLLGREFQVNANTQKEWTNSINFSPC